jgi:hypothetical protein
VVLITILTEIINRIHLDITEQKEQEEQLYLLSLIAEKNINAVVVSDKRKVEWANASLP